MGNVRVEIIETMQHQKGTERRDALDRKVIYGILRYIRQKGNVRCFKKYMVSGLE